jgi:Zn-dependent protease
MDAELFAGSILILLFSIIVHEVAHGLAALYYGDHTAQHAGRLTLNPIPHIDLIGSILLPAMGFLFGGMIFGWAKPVPVNPFNFRNIRQGELVVALAGVTANLILATIAAILFHLFGNTLFFPTFSLLMTNAVQINLLLMVFNLIPIPPLDGSKVLMTFLPPHLELSYKRLEQYGFMILIFLFFTPLGTPLRLFIYYVMNFFRSLLGV